MSAQREERGNQIEFTANFWSTALPEAEPTTAEISLSFMQNGVRSLKTYGMVRSIVDGKWRYVWDSSEAGDGRVFAAVRCDGPLKATKQKSFILAANPANGGEEY